MAASTHCLFLLLFSKNACTCLPDNASPSGTECSMQSPIQNANNYQEQQKTRKTKNLVRTAVTKLLETLRRKKCHLLSTTLAARTSALPQTLTFLAASLVSPERDANGLLGQDTQKGRSSSEEMPAASPASESSGNLLSCQSLQGLWYYSPSMDRYVSFLWGSL